MYSWMIVYCISSASRSLIAQKVMTQRTHIILNNLPRLPRMSVISQPTVSGIGGRGHPGYTHGCPKVDPYPYPLKTRTRRHGCGFLDGYCSHGCGLRPVAGIPVFVADGGHNVTRRDTGKQCSSHFSL